MNIQLFADNDSDYISHLQEKHDAEVTNKILYNSMKFAGEISTIPQGPKPSEKSILLTAEEITEASQSLFDYAANLPDSNPIYEIIDDVTKPPRFSNALTVKSTDSIFSDEDGNPVPFFQLNVLNLISSSSIVFTHTQFGVRSLLAEVPTDEGIYLHNSIEIKKSLLADETAIKYLLKYCLDLDIDSVEVISDAIRVTLNKPKESSTRDNMEAQNIELYKVNESDEFVRFSSQPITMLIYEISPDE